MNRSSFILIIIASVFIMLISNSTLTLKSFGELGQLNEPPRPNIVTSQITNTSETSGDTKDTEQQDNSTSPQAGISTGNFCLKGTGPGTSKSCTPCNPTSMQGGTECYVSPRQSNLKGQLKLPQSFASWFKSGVQDLEKEKTIPTGSANSLLSLQQIDPNTLSKLCKSISKDQNSDLKSSDCNSLQGQKAEETKWIIAGWTVGKLFDKNKQNSINPESPTTP